MRALLPPLHRHYPSPWRWKKSLTHTFHAIISVWTPGAIVQSKVTFFAFILLVLCLYEMISIRPHTRGRGTLLHYMLRNQPSLILQSTRDRARLKFSPIAGFSSITIVALTLVQQVIFIKFSSNSHQIFITNKALLGYPTPSYHI